MILRERLTVEKPMMSFGALVEMDMETAEMLGCGCSLAARGADGAAAAGPALALAACKAAGAAETVGCVQRPRPSLSSIRARDTFAGPEGRLVIGADQHSWPICPVFAPRACVRDAGHGGADDERLMSGWMSMEWGDGMWIRMHGAKFISFVHV